MKRAIVLAALLGSVFSPLTSLAATTAVAKKAVVPTGTELKIFSPSGTLVSSFRPFYKAGDVAGSLAVGDLGKDGTSEIVVGAGPGNKPLVHVMRQDGSLIKEFSAYSDGMKSGVNVAICDLNGDGLSDIVTGAESGGGPQVREFAADGTDLKTSFFAYDEGSRSGVNVACGDVTGDGKPEIITGAGPGGGTDIKIFAPDGTLKSTLSLSGAPEKSGAYVFLANLDQDIESEIVSAPMNNGAFDLTVFDNTSTGFVSSTKQLGLTAPSYGLSVTSDMRTLITANGAYSSLQKITNSLSGASFTPFPDAPDVSPTISIIPESGNIVALASTNTIPFDPTTQFIKVDISEQRLYAYVNNVQVKTFLVSTAKKGFKTPVGKTTILAKIAKMDYVWNYGKDDPRNYNLPNVKWNMRIFPHIYIHSAYWHHNFGHPMSHGCVNTSIPDADWIYHWATEGVAVETVT